MAKEIIRRVRFTPYRKGCGPTFTLTVWDTYRTVRNGPQWQLGYRLTMTNTINYAHVGTRYAKRVVLFEGEDYGCSPCHAIDSNESIVGLMGFLTCKPGDTDSEYFASYTPEQLEYCDQHAEALACEVDSRFCDENGRVKERGR